MLDIKEYLKQTKTVLLTQDAFDELMHRATAQPERCEDCETFRKARLLIPQPDLSGYSDRLWKAAYERGKAEAQPDIIHCVECKYYDDSDGCFFSTATTGANGFCHWAKRKEGGAE